LSKVYTTKYYGCKKKYMPDGLKLESKSMINLENQQYKNTYYLVRFNETEEEYQLHILSSEPGEEKEH
jgi:hypothetical protein